MSEPFVNQSFSKELPGLQLVVDQTSLGEFKECPRKYYYRVIEGWTPRVQSPHLMFGSLMHSSCEKYAYAKTQGMTHQQALRVAVRHILSARWNSEHKEKNLRSLLRSVVWYLDSFGEKDRLQTITLANGKPAVELSFRYNPIDFETGEPLTALTGEPIEFSGHLDRMVTLEGESFFCDLKTTGNTLGPNYFLQYTPDNQFSMYALAGRIAFGVNVTGVICDAVQVKITLSRFERQIVYRTEAQLREWYNDTVFWLDLMGKMAEQKRWPQNDKACHMYGGCPYRAVCSRSPGVARQNWLQLDYVHRYWDPSIPRGE
jgi:CRISPR/Cas system-associated exonuclease Cas4 (RecB family)